MIKKNIIFLLLLFILSGCDGAETWCLSSSSDSYDNLDSVKQVTNTTLKINSTSSTYSCQEGDTACISERYGKWVSTGFSVKEGDEFELSVGGTIVIAESLAENENDGLGEKWVIHANKNNPTEIVGTVFSPNQQITVTTKDCGTSSEDYGSTEPTKWTWKSGWKYDNVYCYGNGSSWEDPTTYIPDSGIDEIDDSIDDAVNGGVPSGACAAVRCAKTCIDYGFGKECFCTTMYNWTCEHQADNYSTPVYSDAIHNVCPITNGELKEPYVCDTNKAAPSNGCYAPTSPPYLPEKDDYCDGKVNCSGEYCSDSHPGNNGTDDFSVISSPPDNTCGHRDSCWNTGGYQLYAIEEGAQCPVYCESGDTNTAEEDRCPAGCNHLNGSYETYDETGGGQPAGGKSFAAIGGKLYLQIINPNTNPDSLDEDAAANAQAKIEENNINIKALEDENDALYAQLEPQHNLVNDYKDDAKKLEEDAILLSGGLTSEYQATIDQLTSIAKLFNYPPYDTVDENGNAITVNPADLEESFTTFDSQINLSGQYTNEEGAEPQNIEWKYTINTMSDQALGVIDAGNALNTNVSPSGQTTPQELETYKNDLNSILSELDAAITEAERLQKEIEDNNKEISDLEADNEVQNQIILETNVYSNEDLVGGYTVYVKAGPFVGENGQYLHAVICDQDPNLSADTAGSVSCPTLFNNGTSKMLYAYEAAMPASGTVWLRIEDPDGDYANNSQWYDVIFGKVSYTSGFNSILTGMIEDIKNNVTSAARRIFVGLTCSDGGEMSGQCSGYISAISALLYLYVIIFGMMYLFGLIKYTHVDFVMRIVKIATVTILIQPSSFEFFNTYLFNGFTGFTDTLIVNATGAPVSNPFDFLALNFNVLIMDETTYFKIIGIMFQGLLGLVAFILLIHGVFNFVSAFFSAFLVYMMAFVGLGICFALAPIFLSFLLFEKTSYLFDNWFKMMVKLTVQPVILLVGLIIINGMLTTILDQIFNYPVCFKCTVPFIFALPGFDQVGTTTLFCVYWFSEWGADNVGSTLSKQLMSIPLAINFCLVTSIMKVYADKLANDVTSSIVGGTGGLPGAGGGNTTIGNDPSQGLSGLNPLKGLDDQARNFAVRTGLATDAKSYSALRNKALKGAVKFGVATSNPFMAISAVRSHFSPGSVEKPEDNSSNQPIDSEVPVNSPSSSAEVSVSSPSSPAEVSVNSSDAPIAPTVVKSVGSSSRSNKVTPLSRTSSDDDNPLG